MVASSMRNIWLPILVLTALYGLVVWGLILLFRALRIPARWAIVLGFVVFGVTTGLLAAWAWPLDSCVYLNVYGTLLGDAIYRLSTEHLGGPWLLGVPQVYVSASAFPFGILGLAAQWIYGMRPRPLTKEEE